MTIDTRQLHPVFVGEVIGVDLRQPLDPGTFREIEAALDRYAVLVFRNQFLDDDQQIAFSRLFGPLETSIGTIRKDRRHRLRPELSDVSNLDANNNIRPTSDRWRMMLLANELWHTDSSFRRCQPNISAVGARGSS